MSKKKRPFIIGGLIIFLAVGFLGFNAFKNSATYFYTVDEVLAKGNTVYGENVRVEGLVNDGSVVRESVGRLLKFTISDNGSRQNLSVIYIGVVPDTFKESIPVVVEGAINSDGIFEANTLLPKCPSKYEPSEATPAQ